MRYFGPQLLSYLGYVELDYDKIEGEVMDALDLDQDGKVNTGDVQELFDRTMKVPHYSCSPSCLLL